MAVSNRVLPGNDALAFKPARASGEVTVSGVIWSFLQPIKGHTGAVTEDSLLQSDDREIRRALKRRAVSIVLAVAPFGLVFGAAASTAGLTMLEALGFSVFVFAGSSQFAAVEILGDGGSVAAAAVAGLLLNVRSLAFGVIMAPALVGPWWKRAAMSQLMIDESTAVGTAATELRHRRYGYLIGGIGVFVVWNLTTLIGFALFSGAGDLITDLGLDVAGPAAFLALLWPRLTQRRQLVTAVAGAAIAIALVPVAPAGVPILASMLGVLVAVQIPEPAPDVKPAADVKPVVR
jgi:predicted branched-subunit amino acid permease